MINPFLWGEGVSVGIFMNIFGEKSKTCGEGFEGNEVC